MSSICQYCGHKLTDGKCLNPACPGRLIVHKFSLPDGKLVEIADERIWIYGPFDYLTTDEIDVIHAEIHRNDPDIAEVERLVDDLLSVSKQLGQSEARGLYDHIEPAEVAINDLKSSLLVALSNTTPYLSGDVNVPVEELEAGRYRMMIPVEISTTGGLLLDRRDGLHGYSLEDYPNARFFKGW